MPRYFFAPFPIVPQPLSISGEQKMKSSSLYFIECEGYCISLPKTHARPLWENGFIRKNKQAPRC